MTRLGMVLDLKRCIGCYSCAIACKAENATPPGVFWAQVLEWEEGKYPTAHRVFFPILCNQCQDPPCLKACPTQATSQRADGIVLIDYNKCIGCKACMVACPYQARFFLGDLNPYFSGVLTPYESAGYSKFVKGVVTKCTLCAHRVDQGLEPACVKTCIAKARIFGDLDDPQSEPRQAMRNRHSFQFKAEIGTNPSVFYIA